MVMRTVGLAEAKAQLSALLDAVEAGEEVAITRRGLLVSTFHNDSGDPAAEAWLAAAGERELWISHWVLLEFTSATAVRWRRGELPSGKVDRIHRAFEAFQRERLGMLEPEGSTW